MEYFNLTLKDKANAEKMAKTSYQIAIKNYSDDLTSTIKIIADYGNINRLLNNYERSEQLLLKALERAQKLLGENNIIIAIIQGNLGILYGTIGNQNKQNDYLQSSSKLFKKLLPLSHPYNTKMNKLLNKKASDFKNTFDMGYIARILIA